MSQEETPASEAIEQKLSRLRMRIDRLPPEQRPHLVELADAIASHCRHLEESKTPSLDSR
jgi:hypothetical protein